VNVANEKMKKTQRKVIKWSISTMIPSLLIFILAQIVSGWNLSRIVHEIEESEKIMVSFNEIYEAWPERSTYESGSRLEAKYWAETHGWVVGIVAPEAEKHLARLQKNTSDLKAMRLWTWDDSIKLARASYIRHAVVWEELMNSQSQCLILQCVEVTFDDYGDEIESSFISAETEFNRISPRFDVFRVVARINKIFSDQDEN
jgi:hypothetical protein